MNIRNLNRVLTALDNAFDSFLEGALYPLLAVGALLVYFGRVWT